MSNTGNMTNTRKGNSILSKMLLLFCMVVVFPRQAIAQVVPRDIPTIEAYINDHKKQRSLLLARATLEESNALLHKASKVTHREYRDINIELVYSTVSTGFNVYRTYDNVSDKIGKYKTLLEEFNEKIIQRGRIESADTLLLFVNGRAVVNLAEECQNLYSSVCVLAAYASGKVCCTTASLMLMIDNINKSLDRIKDIVNSAYYQTWKFIKARTSFWKSELYRSKTIRQLADEAFDRWMDAGNILDY